MESCTRACGAIARLFSDPMPTTSMEWGGVICPRPIRAPVEPWLSDGSSSSILYCKPKRLDLRNCQSEIDVLSSILDQDDDDYEFDMSLRGGFWCNSPPLRSSNPLIHDVAFGKLNSPMLSTLGALHSPMMERSSPCGASSCSCTPQIRIEGFSCGSSDSHCMVPALLA